MAKQKSNHKFIYKIESKRLREAKWNYTLPLFKAMDNGTDIVALNDSQILRWILELNGIKDFDEKVNDVKSKIKYYKKLERSRSTKEKIKNLYKLQYSLQYQTDYLNMIISRMSDYDRLNKGFKINDINYKRLLGTNGGIKKSTITYVSEDVYNEIKKRIDCGRNKNYKLLPAKLEAYQALVCSGSIPVTTPRIIVVKDCFTTFKEDVITISDNPDSGKEPIVKYEKDFEINYCDSDGYGFMSPEYSMKINEELYGDKFKGQTISGVNTRYAWTKGMIVTFDFVKFAKEKANENYMIMDAWGDWRDVRECDVILTTSMVKLWDAYDDFEHYSKCCEENHYQFSVAKTAEHELENVRNSNYQFLQDYILTDDEIKELCQPTIDEIKGAMGADYRQALVFLKGMYTNEKDVRYTENDIIKALMINKEVMNDSFIKDKIKKMIDKRIKMAAKGSLKLPANFSIIAGDPYSLAQSIFGLPITGIMKAGEIYNKYWLDKESEYVACFRAPMTSHHNVVKRKVHDSELAREWYKYITTCTLLNSWDSTCDCENGADKDGDLFFLTDSDVLVRNIRNLPAIECMQRKTQKIIPTEEDIILANKLAFGDDIGTVTNRITSMIEVRSNFEPGSKEYATLTKRIICGQHYQQATIDRAKGIIAEPMPEHWYSKSPCMLNEDKNKKLKPGELKFIEESDEEKQEKIFNMKLVAFRKPYFMKYVYPDLMNKYNKYIKNTNKKSIRQFGMTIDELREYKSNDINEKLSIDTFLKYYDDLMPVGCGPCVVNKISWLIEDEFMNNKNKSNKKQKEVFDYTIYKSDCEYSSSIYTNVKSIYDEYIEKIKKQSELSKTTFVPKEDFKNSKLILLENYKKKCTEACTNEKELCNILLDLCYKSSKSKQFVWDVCGKTIIENMLEKSNNVIYYPELIKDKNLITDESFEFSGEYFNMKEFKYKEDEEMNETNDIRNEED